jgi:hypothetical protein
VKARWWSQRFAPEGSAAGEGIARQLGVPSLDPLTVLVREAAQNSWDARKSGSHLNFTISIRCLGREHAAWQNYLVPPPDLRSGIRLEEHLRPESTILVVSDRGTVGLGGPLRAGHRATGPERPDFVQFLRNVGEPSDHEFGGGTYGFGKGIFFRISGADAIIVNTCTSSSGPYTRRLMGAALGKSWYDAKDFRYTGRHWWGEVTDDIPDPATAEDAGQIAGDLGLPAFQAAETGTDIVVLGADLGASWNGDTPTPRNREQAGQFIASSMLWHLWPKMVPDAESDRPPMTFGVEVDGHQIDIPAPCDVPELRPFVDALLRIRRGDCSRCARTVVPRVSGYFAHELAPSNVSPANRPVVSIARPFDPPTHHTVRMRTAELVVDYLPGPPHSDPLFEYSAVFKSSVEADPYFASTEPPTHDSWVEKGLTGTARGVVQGSRRFITKQLEDALAGTIITGTAGGAALGELAQRLSAIVPGGIMTSRDDGGPDALGPSRDATGIASNGGRPVAGAAPSSGNGSLRPVGPDSRPRVLGSPALRFIEGQPFIVARVGIPLAASDRLVEATVQVVVDGGGVEGEAPVGVHRSTILEWQQVETGRVTRGPVLSLAAGDGGDWWVVAAYVPDAVVRVKVAYSAVHHVR